LSAQVAVIVSPSRIDVIARLDALLAQAGCLPAVERAQLAEEWATHQPPGTLLVTTCHRVEIFGTSPSLGELAAALPPGVRSIEGSAVVQHLVELAIGRRSAVIGEDQLLHQMRQAAQSARARGELPRELDRLVDIALRAGRRARSWLPAPRMSLADIALAHAIGTGDVSGARLLVVGTGEIGRRAVGNLVARGGLVTVASRTEETARTMAKRYGAAVASFDPGADTVGAMTGVVVALGGPWRIADETASALRAATSWVVDLSSPGALVANLDRALGDRLISIDDLAELAGRPLSHRLLEQLDALVVETVAEYERWLADDDRRAAADALARRARSLQVSELERLWQRLPSLDQGERDEVERAVEQVTRRLLSDPLEQLGRDADGRHAQAARELFRL
jgi:glutamyl-tRNA reductase